MDPLAPVTGLIDRAEDLLGHSPHPAVIAVPLGAWTVSCVCDGLALLTGDRQYDDYQDENNYQYGSHSNCLNHSSTDSIILL